MLILLYYISNYFNRDNFSKTQTTVINWSSTENHKYNAACWIKKNKFPFISLVIM